jgi:hypothetical protein
MAVTNSRDKITGHKKRNSIRVPFFMVDLQNRLLCFVSFFCPSFFESFDIRTNQPVHGEIDQENHKPESHREDGQEQ